MNGASNAAIHATAVAIDGRALLICGASRSGKSRLALSLIAASTRRRPIRLIGDDRIVLTPSLSGLLARPHPRIAGFIERRGLGIVAVPHVASAPVAAIAAFDDRSSTLSRLDLQGFPVLHFASCGMQARHDHVLDWWDQVLDWWDHVQTATCAQHLFAKAAEPDSAVRKD